MLQVFQLSDGRRKLSKEISLYRKALEPFEEAYLGGYQIRPALQYVNMQGCKLRQEPQLAGQFGDFSLECERTKSF